MIAPTVAVDSISAQMVTSTQSMRKPLPVGSGNGNGNGEDNGNGNVRKSQTPTVGSSGGGPVVTAPQCIECAERRMRVQSMEARCWSGILLRQQKMFIVATKKGYEATQIW